MHPSEAIQAWREAISRVREAYIDFDNALENTLQHDAAVPSRIIEQLALARADADHVFGDLLAALRARESSGQASESLAKGEKQSA